MTSCSSRSSSFYHGRLIWPTNNTAIAKLRTVLHKTTCRQPHTACQGLILWIELFSVFNLSFCLNFTNWSGASFRFQNSFYFSLGHSDHLLDCLWLAQSTIVELWYRLAQLAVTTGTAQMAPQLSSESFRCTWLTVKVYLSLFIACMGVLFVHTLPLNKISCTLHACAWACFEATIGTCIRRGSAWRMEGSILDGQTKRCVVARSTICIHPTPTLDAMYTPFFVHEVFWVEHSTTRQMIDFLFLLLLLFFYRF